jgi:CBS domain-containing protein
LLAATAHALISVFFFTGATCRNFIDHLAAYDSMRTIPDSENPIRVQPNTTLGEVIKQLIHFNIHRVFVTDSATRKPIGIVSLYDILSKLVSV